VKREQLLARIDAAWNAFQDSYSGLADERLVEPGVAGDWSVKDVIAHVTWWEEEALIHLPHIVEGGRPPRYSVTYGGIDAFNALMADRKRQLLLAEVRRQAAATHQRLIDYIESVPEEFITRETRFRRRLRLDSYSHYPIHTEAIRRWRQERAGTG
jgi:hypothetical protein